MSDSLLLIAIGNTLRQDDGAGHELAARLEPILRAANISMKVEHAHQLLPEHAETVADAAYVVFLDAGAGARQPVEWRELTPDHGSAPLGHHAQPEAILAIAKGLYGKTPVARLLTIRGIQFDHGEGLSSEALAAVNQAMEYSKVIVEEYFRIARIRPRPTDASDCFGSMRDKPHGL